MSLRAGLAHYNTRDEVDRLVAALAYIHEICLRLCRRSSRVSNKARASCSRVQRLGFLAVAVVLLVPMSGNAATTQTRTGVFSGFAFDACAAPSTNALTAWAASPYRAVGIYIGGTNRACKQPNLTASWVQTTLSPVG